MSTKLIASAAARRAAARAGYVPAAISPSDMLAQAARLYEAWRTVRETAPEVFDLEKPVPLAIGVHEELADLGVPLTIAGEVAPEHRAHAAALSRQ